MLLIFILYNYFIKFDKMKFYLKKNESEHQWIRDRDIIYHYHYHYHYSE